MTVKRSFLGRVSGAEILPDSGTLIFPFCEVDPASFGWKTTEGGIEGKARMIGSTAFGGFRVELIYELESGEFVIF